jgi:hypothetical protein
MFYLQLLKQPQQIRIVSVVEDHETFAAISPHEQRTMEVVVLRTGVHIHPSDGDRMCVTSRPRLRLMHCAMRYDDMNNGARSHHIHSAPRASYLCVYQGAFSHLSRLRRFDVDAMRQQAPHNQHPQ